MKNLEIIDVVKQRYESGRGVCHNELPDSYFAIVLSKQSKRIGVLEISSVNKYKISIMDNSEVYTDISFESVDDPDELNIHCNGEIFNIVDTFGRKKLAKTIYKLNDIFNKGECDNGYCLYQKLFILSIDSGRMMKLNMYEYVGLVENQSGCIYPIHIDLSDKISMRIVRPYSCSLSGINVYHENVTADDIIDHFRIYSSDIDGPIFKFIDPINVGINPIELFEKFNNMEKFPIILDKDIVDFDERFEIERIYDRIIHTQYGLMNIIYGSEQFNFMSNMTYDLRHESSSVNISNICRLCAQIYRFNIHANKVICSYRFQ